MILGVDLGTLVDYFTGFLGLLRPGDQGSGSNYGVPYEAESTYPFIMGLQ